MSADYLPALPFVRVEADGAHWLAGSRCSACGAVFPGTRRACASCGGRDTIAEVRLGETGTLYNFTIVHRSYPGVKTPFVSAIVDLDGGGSLRGTLLDVEPDPDTLARDLKIRVTFRDSGQTDKDGRPFLAYYFVPEGAPA